MERRDRILYLPGFSPFSTVGGENQRCHFLLKALLCKFDVDVIVDSIHRIVDNPSLQALLSKNGYAAINTDYNVDAFIRLFYKGIDSIQNL